MPPALCNVCTGGKQCCCLVPCAVPMHQNQKAATCEHNRYNIAYPKLVDCLGICHKRNDYTRQTSMLPAALWRTSSKEAAECMLRRRYLQTRSLSLVHISGTSNAGLSLCMTMLSGDHPQERQRLAEDTSSPLVLFVLTPHRSILGKATAWTKATW